MRTMWGSLFALYLSVLIWYHYGMKTSYNLRMDEELKKDLEQMAREEGRSLNNMICFLLRCAIVNGEVLRRLKVKEKGK